MKVCILFGGSGYIGTFIVKNFVKSGRFDKIIIADIVASTVVHSICEYLYLDVRNSISLALPKNLDREKSWIFNLAAIHREPGHDQHEYYDTNISGAENINSFAEEAGIKNIFFTSSIAPYGRSLELRTESSQLYAETPYGISKGMAEKIHQIWQAKDGSRKLVIVRPSVIYGPGDPGNVLRMIKALQKGTFVLPNSSEIIKAYGYIYGLVESVSFTMEKDEPLIIYNYAENPVVPIGEMCKIIKKSLNIKKPIVKSPMVILVIIAKFIQCTGKIFGKKSSIHPVRVRKAGFPTNIKPQWLIEKGFEFKYDFEKSLEHWKEVAPEDFKCHKFRYLN